VFRKMIVINMKKIIYIILFFLVIPGSLVAQENINREVKLYNPFKPTLSWENKIHFSPEIIDTSDVSPLFNYNISPRVFMPEYSVRTISAAKLEPDPLKKLYKSYLKLGFGNYFSPLGELSISSERSRNKIIGFYAGHSSSFGKLKLENDDQVFAGYMDNYATLYGTRLFRRSALAGNIDFDHIRRYAYGYDSYNLLPTEPDKDSLRIDYFMPSAKVNFYSTRLDSSHLDYDIKLTYNLVLQNKDFYQHNPGLEVQLGYNFKSFYARADIAYELFLFSDSINNNASHLVTVNPSIGKLGNNWSFKAGAKIKTYSRDVFASGQDVDYNTKLYLHPDVRFQFTVIPSFVVFYIGLDGELMDNRARKIIETNPRLIYHDPATGVVPSGELYRINPTNNILRFGGGIMGSAGEFTTYKISGSYTLFDNMLFFANDTVAGRAFYPLYDDGELLKIYGEFNSRINDEFSVSAYATIYSYKLEQLDYPWYMPKWEGRVSVKYNLRNKIIANIDINGLSERYGLYGLMPYNTDIDPYAMKFPAHFSINLGAEYRYTNILSFWTRLNNISANRYFEYGFYPSQRFLFMAGFTYSM